MKTVNVLIFPAVDANAVELHDSLSHNLNVRVYGASSIERHGAYVFKNYRAGLPMITDPDFLEKFNALLLEWEIDFVFTTHDSVLLFLAENQNSISAKIINGDVETARICRSKSLTYQLFRNESFCPTIFSNFETYPCFIKPSESQGGKGAKLIHSEADIPSEFSPDSYVIMEYLPGEEYTVDCLTDRTGSLIAVLPRERARTLAGISVAGKAMQATQDIQNIAECLNKNITFRGLWFFQIKKDRHGKFKLLEVAARCAGTMCLSRARGINLPLLSVYIAQGLDVGVFENPYSVRMDRSLISRYKIDYEYNSVYIDYDDTLIEGESVCLPAIRFLYQCKNVKKKIVLLTRHELYHTDSIEESLKKHSIDRGLFSEIVRVSKEEDKAKYICPDSSIFIDNAYVERKKVYEQYHIPVFDVEGIEVLTDWRC